MSEGLQITYVAVALLGGVALMVGGLVRHRGNVADAAPEMFMGFFGVIGGLVCGLALS